MLLRLVRPFVTVLALLLGVGAVRGDEKVNLKWGNPSKADKKSDNFLLVKKFFVLSYNNKRGTPNWVSWRLVKGDMGDAPRRPSFLPDSDLPAGFKKIGHKDYGNSGFDRGHMCPRSDRDATKESSFATFVMTNIVPQAPRLNQGPWNDLEIYGRFLVEKKKKTLYVITGGQGIGGRGRMGFRTTIAGGKVTVPSKCWKVILVLDANEDKVTESARVIAVVMPNDNDVVQDWKRYRVPLVEVEKLTGYTFFEKAFKGVDEELVRVLREETDRERIPRFDRPDH